GLSRVDPARRRALRARGHARAGPRSPRGVRGARPARPGLRRLQVPRARPGARLPVTPAVRLHDVHKRYGRRTVLAGVSLDIAPGARLGLIGPSASGETVLCKLICGLEHADRGSIEVLGEDLTGRREAELGAVRRRIGMLFQNAALFDFLSVA